MIVSFAGAETKLLWETGRSRGIPAHVRPAAWRKLMILNAALDLENLRVPRNNRLEVWTRDRKGQHSIRVNDPYRICFAWKAGNACEVEVELPLKDRGNLMSHASPRVKSVHAIHPGEILLKEFLQPIGLTRYRLAKDIHVTLPRINDIVHGKRSISADTALRLGAYFGLPAQFWMNLQADYDLRLARTNKDLKKIKPRAAA